MPRPPASNALFTDLYQLTMAQAYHRGGQTGDAAFSLYFRNFPPNRAYYVFCGLESAVEYLRNLRFDDDDLTALDGLGIFDSGFLDFLGGLRFSGEVRAMREGEIFFPEEPVMEVSGPVIECQLAETFILNRVNLESMLATKAARVVDAAGGRSVMDFSARRTHGQDAALKMARASYIAGFSGTSNVMAAAELGIPALGTMAHSYILTHRSEREAFREYARAFPDSSVFLVDTYDTLRGVENAISVAREMEADGHKLRAIRLDSGDFDALSRQARRLLNEAGLDYVQILASGGLDEFSIDELAANGTPIDGFGVGTKVGSSADAPYTDFVYKLVEYDGAAAMKLSDGKESLPGRKQVFRQTGADGVIRGDVLGLHDSASPSDEAEPLLKTVMERGELISPLPDLDDIRAYHAGRTRSLPEGLKAVRPPGSYPVGVSDELAELTRRTTERIRSGKTR